MRQMVAVCVRVYLECDCNVALVEDASHRS